MKVHVSNTKTTPCTPSLEDVLPNEAREAGYATSMDGGLITTPPVVVLDEAASICSAKTTPCSTSEEKNA